MVDGGEETTLPLLVGRSYTGKLGHRLDQQNLRKTAIVVGDPFEGSGGQTGLAGENPVEKEKRVPVREICGRILVKQRPLR